MKGRGKENIFFKYAKKRGVDGKTSQMLTKLIHLLPHLPEKECNFPSILGALSTNYKYKK